MSKPRDWQDKYYDGDDLFDPETPVPEVDDDLAEWYDVGTWPVTYVDEEAWEWLVRFLEEEDAT